MIPAGDSFLCLLDLQDVFSGTIVFIRMGIFVLLDGYCNHLEWVNR